MATERKEIERRILPGRMEVRKSNGKSSVEGYAAVFNTLSEDMGYDFREKVAPGAFSNALKEGQDVRCLVDHDSSLILGRTSAKTLEIREDKHGLWFRCDIPDTQAGRDVVTSIERGDVTGCSFAFSLREDGDTWQKEGDMQVRVVTDVDLYDVGPVTFPAYPATDVSVARRSLDRYRSERDAEAERDVYARRIAEALRK